VVEEEQRRQSSRKRRSGKPYNNSTYNTDSYTGPTKFEKDQVGDKTFVYYPNAPVHTSAVMHPSHPKRGMYTAAMTLAGYKLSKFKKIG